MQHISQVELNVIKEGSIVYEEGCPMSIPCHNTVVGIERVAINSGGEGCTGIGMPGDIFPLSYTGLRETLVAVKLDIPDRGVVWVEKTHYDANIGKCNDCCVPLDQLGNIEGFSVTPGDTENVLNWDDLADAEGYVLERSLDNGFASPVVVYTGTVSGYTNTGLTNGTEYFYRVKATAAGKLDSEWAFASGTPTV